MRVLRLLMFGAAIAACAPSPLRVPVADPDFVPSEPPPHGPIDWQARLFPPTPPAPPPPPPVAPALPPTPSGPAHWRLDRDAEGEFWQRSPGERAPDLVLRGLTSPKHSLSWDTSFAPGARFGVHLRIALPHALPHLRLWLRAAGPFGVRTNSAVAVGDATTPVDITLDGTSERVDIDLADIDRPLARRGQTVPYVLVLSEDVSAKRNEEPDPRPRQAPGTLLVRWDIHPSPCPHPDSSYENSCYDGWLVVGGGRLKLPEPLVAQDDCWPDGTGVVCAGASGGTQYVLSVEAGNRVKLTAHSEGDGYCPPGEDCATHSVLTTFPIPPGAELVPDPAGTFPPRP